MKDTPFETGDPVAVRRYEHPCTGDDAVDLMAGLAAVLRSYPNLSPEEAQGALEWFFYRSTHKHRPGRTR